MYQTRIRFVLIAGALGALLLVAGLPSLTHVALADLPPRPTPVPLPQPSLQPQPQPQFSGGFIELRVQFDQAWPWADVHWQELWGVVQQQENWKDWRDSTGWQGTLDEFADGRGKKVWWVAQEHLGLGPFRWAVYRGKGGALLAMSAPFYLPDARGKTVTVDVALGP